MIKNLLAAACCFITSALTAQQRVGIGNSNPQALLSVGTNSAFRVDSTGNIKRINDVPFSFPVEQGAANEHLANDGSGNLLWKRPVPQDAVVLSPQINDSLVTAGYALYGKYFLKDFSFAGPQKNGQWELLTVANQPAGFTNPTHFQFTGGFNEFVSYSSDGSLYFNSLDGSNWYVSPQVSLPGFQLVRNNANLLCLGNEVFVIGGYGSGFNDLASCARYNLQTNAWSPMAAMPDSLAATTGCASDGKLYIFGGFEYDAGGINAKLNNMLFVYDIASDTWTSSAIDWAGTGLPSNNGTAIKIGNKIRIAGGNTFTDPPLGIRELDLNTMTVSVVSFNRNISHASFTFDANNVLWTCISDPDMYFYKEETGQQLSYELAPDAFNIYGIGGSVWYGGKLYIRTIFGLFKFTPDAGPFKNVFLPKIDRMMFMYIKQ